jgi:cellulose synthase/poly-beta-1,6-N-acetylglucosamine synthase-like glycosyltransferase
VHRLTSKSGTRRGRRNRRRGATIISEPRLGLAHARQAGLEAARGEFLIFVDADTRLPNGWTGEVLRYFADEDLVALSPGFTFYDGRARDNLGNFVFRSLLCPVANLVLRQSNRPGVLIGSAIALRTDALRRAGGVDLAFQFYGEDTMLARRLHSQGKVCFTRNPAYLTSARRYQQGGILNVVFRYFLIFAIIHLGRMEAASNVARRFCVCDRRGPGSAMCRKLSIRLRPRRTDRVRR